MSKKQWWIQKTCHGCDNAYRSPLDASTFHEDLVLVQEVEQVESPMSLAQEAYEAYRDAFGIAGNPLEFNELSLETKSAWTVSAVWIAGRVLRLHDEKEK